MSKTLFLTEHPEFGELVLLFLALIIPSFIVAFIHFWVNVTIFSQLSKKGHDEAEYLNSLKNRIKKLDGEINGEPRPTSEDMKHQKENIDYFIKQLK